VLQSLSTFLHKALSFPHYYSSAAVNPAAMTINTWYLMSSFTTPEAYDAFDLLLQPSLHTKISRRYWQPEIDSEMVDNNSVQNYSLARPPYDSPWTLKHLSDAAGGPSEAGIPRMGNSTYIAVCLPIVLNTMRLTGQVASSSNFALYFGVHISRLCTYSLCT
jgi:pre-rRNA-processing protein IPI1